MNFFIGKRKLFFMVVLLLASFLLAAFSQPERKSCPAGVQMGEVDIQIPAEGMVGMKEIQIVRCAGMNVQVTGGTMLQAPVLVNGIVHHDSLILSVHLLESQPGPVDVTLWWRVD